jgi:hypothetical protein
MQMTMRRNVSFVEIRSTRSNLFGSTPQRCGESNFEYLHSSGPLEPKEGTARPSRIYQAAGGAGGGRARCVCVCVCVCVCGGGSSSSLSPGANQARCEARCSLCTPPRPRPACSGHLYRITNNQAMPLAVKKARGSCNRVAPRPGRAVFARFFCFFLGVQSINRRSR